MTELARAVIWFVLQDAGRECGVSDSHRLRIARSTALSERGRAAAWLQIAQTVALNYSRQNKGVEFLAEDLLATAAGLASHYRAEARGLGMFQRDEEEG